VGTQSVYERLCEQLTSTQQALTAAQASQGWQQILQAQAQIQALSSEQLATISQIEAANGRVQTEWIALQAKERSDADAHHTNFMEGFGAQGFRAIGQGNGFKLP
jgi:conjugal transfer/entry exclusion protein